MSNHRQHRFRGSDIYKNLLFLNSGAAVSVTLGAELVMVKFFLPKQNKPLQYLCPDTNCVGAWGIVAVGRYLVFKVTASHQISGNRLLYPQRIAVL